MMRRDERGVSAVIGAVLLAAILVAVLLTIRLSYVPVWEKDAASVRYLGAESQLAKLRADLDRQTDNRTASVVASPITLGEQRASIFKESENPHSLKFTSDGVGMALGANQLLIVQS